MGQPDLSTKGLISYLDVAADIVNVFVYNGKPIVHETDLRPYVTSENVVSTEGKLKGLSRDNCMENIRDGMRYAIFGFENQDDIPAIRLPVRTEHSTIEEIITSFIEAITDYYAWLCNELDEGYVADENDVEEILQTYLQYKE